MSDQGFCWCHMSHYNHFLIYASIYFLNSIDMTSTQPYNSAVNNPHIIAYTKSKMEPLTWDATFAIALALKRLYPNQNLNDVSLRQVFLWTIALPEFVDEPALGNEDILADIYQAWYEETTHDR